MCGWPVNILIIATLQYIYIYIYICINLVPAYLMWLIGWERNNLTFEDIVRSIDLLKPILVGTLFQWGKIGVLHNVFPFLNFFFPFVSLLEVLVFVLSSKCSLL